MDFAVRPQPVLPPAISQPDSPPASESGACFAAAVDATFAATDGTLAQKNASLPSAMGTSTLLSPVIGQDMVVAAPDEGAPLPVETPPSVAELTPPSAKVTGREPVASQLTPEPSPKLPEDNADDAVQAHPDPPVAMKKGPKPVSKASEGAEHAPPPAASLVVVVQATDRSGSLRATQRPERKADAATADKDEEPAVAGKAEATIAPAPILPLPAAKLPVSAPNAEGGVARDPGAAKDAISASAKPAAREAEPNATLGTRVSQNDEATGFALPPSATDKGEARPTAPNFASAEPVRSQFHLSEQKPQPAAHPVVAAQPGRLGHDLGVEIARRVSAGGDQLVVRLAPAELGRIEVRMSFDDRGGLSTVFAADSPAALDMLRRDSADLSRALNDAGFRSEANTLRFDSGERGTGGQPRTPWQNATPKGGNSAEPTDPEIFDQTAFRTVQTRGRYDLMA